MGQSTLTSLTISYYCPHWRFRYRGINLPDKIQYSPYARKPENPLIVKLLSRLDSISSHKEIIMCWIPSHIGASRNERADSAAKLALDLSPDNISIPYTDLKPHINKFFLIKGNNAGITLQKTLPNKAHFRRIETSLQKIKEGTNHYISIVDWPHKSLSFFYTQAGTAITREQHFKIDNMSDMFENIQMDDVLTFLRDIELYLKI